MSEKNVGRVSDRLSSGDARNANLEHEGGTSQTSGRPPRPDLLTELRELLETHSIVAMRVNKPYREIRPLLRALADEVERLRCNRPRIKEAALDEILDCDKCDLCEDHHGQD